MSILDTIKAFFSGGSRSGKIYIIDAAQLSGGGNERLGPREQVQVLQQLSRFVEKEKIGVQAVFEGRALREVAHGENYGGVQVFFADNTANLHKLLLALLKKSRNAVLVTGTRQVEERAISMGALTLRPSTFRKAFENGGGGGERGGERGGRERRRGDRRRQPRQQRAAQETQAQQAPQQGDVKPESAAPANGAGEKPPQGNPPKANDPVRNLIDLVE